MLASPLLLEGSEWLIVVVVIGALLVFGPEKIPQIAKQVGRAKAEFDKASNEARTMMDSAMKSIDQEASAAASSISGATSEMTSSLTSTANEMKSSFNSAVTSAQAPPAVSDGSGAQPQAASATLSAGPPPQAPAAQASEVDGDALLKLAHRMGIPTEGKTRDEISEAIFSKSASEPKAPAS